jgi:hypothetical protein
LGYFCLNRPITAMLRCCDVVLQGCWAAGLLRRRSASSSRSSQSAVQARCWLCLHPWISLVFRNL